MLAFLIIVRLAMQVSAQSKPPRILQIFRELLKLGSDGAYRRIDKRTARLRAELDCPHWGLNRSPLSRPKRLSRHFDKQSTCDPVKDANRCVSEAASEPGIFVPPASRWPDGRARCSP